MDILCLYVRCDDTHATVIVKFTQPIQVRKKTNLLLNLLLEWNSPDKFSKPSNLSIESILPDQNLELFRPVLLLFSFSCGKQ